MFVQSAFEFYPASPAVLRKESYVGPSLEFFIGWNGIGQFFEIIQNTATRKRLSLMV